MSILVDLQAHLKFQAEQRIPVTARRHWLLGFRYETHISQAVSHLLALQKQGYHSSAQKISKSYARKK